MNKVISITSNDSYLTVDQPAFHLSFQTPFGISLLFYHSSLSSFWIVSLYHSTGSLNSLPYSYMIYAVSFAILTVHIRCQLLYLVLLSIMNHILYYSLAPIFSQNFPGSLTVPGSVHSPPSIRSISWKFYKPVYWNKHHSYYNLTINCEYINSIPDHFFYLIFRTTFWSSQGRILEGYCHNNAI